MGVYVTAAVAGGVRFGPIPTAIALTDPAILIGHMTCDVRPNIHTVKVGPPALPCSFAVIPIFPTF